MSLLSSFTKKSKLSATIKQTQQARKSEGNAADQLFKSAYAGYAEVLLDDPIRADALYNWGFALLHQAKTKEGAQAEAIYQDAINKFAFCLLINPNYLGAAINGGVAYMDLARLKGAAPDDVLYTLAQKHFEAANKIQTGTASYNLACIYALRGDSQACLQAFELSKERGSLPDASDIMQDPDLATVKEADWFLAFIEPLLPKEEPVVVEEAVAVAEEPAAVEEVAAVAEEPAAVEEAVAEAEEPAAVEEVAAEVEEPAAIEEVAAEVEEPAAVEEVAAEVEEPAAVEEAAAEVEEPAEEEFAEVGEPIAEADVIIVAETDGAADAEETIVAEPGVSYQAHKNRKKK
jgi:hypothetical protein